MQILVRESKQQNPAIIADCLGYTIEGETVLHMECSARHVKSLITFHLFAEET